MRSAFWLLVGRTAVQGLTAAFTILIARRLGDAEFGQYAFVTALVALANVVTTFGTDMMIVRIVAANNNLGVVPAALVIQLILSVPAIGGIWALPAEWFNLSVAGAVALRIYSVALIPMSVANVISAALRGMERMGTLAWLSMIGPASQVIAIVLLVRMVGIVALMELLLALQASIALLSALVFMRATAGGSTIGWRTTLREAYQTATISAPMALLGGLGMLYQRETIYALIWSSGPSAAGWYSAAARVLEVPRLGHYALMGALLPVMAQAYADTSNSADIHPVISRVVAVSMILSSAAALLLAMVASPLVRLLYGQEFMPAAAVLRVLAWALIPGTITNYISIRLLAVGKEQHLLGPLVVATLALSPISLWGIFHWGTPGAAGAVVSVECLLAALSFAAWRRSGLMRPTLRDTHAFSKLP